jgi:hypothetical protein
MVRHEAGCTANPDRACGICSISGLVQRSNADLDEALRNGFKYLDNACEGCPVCILAALRRNPSTGLDEARNNFNFKKSMKEFWVEYNASERVNYDFL